MILFPDHDGGTLRIRIVQIKCNRCIINSSTKVSAHAIAVGPFLALFFFRAGIEYTHCLPDYSEVAQSDPGGRG